MQRNNDASKTFCARWVLVTQRYLDFTVIVTFSKIKFYNSSKSRLFAAELTHEPGAGGFCDLHRRDITGRRQHMLAVA
jgi:hypothetical protein